MHFHTDELRPNDVYNLLIGLVAPRPIAWITSMDRQGKLNAAPFSAFNYFGADPPLVGIGVQNKPGGDGVPKDTARNIRAAGEFVINVVTEDLIEPMNITAIDFAAGVSELEKAGLTTAASSRVKVPRIAQAHAAMECVEVQTIEVGRTRIVIGRVVAFFVEDRFIDPAGPYVRADELHAVGRMNGKGAYVRTRDAFLTLPRLTVEEFEHGKREKVKAGAAGK